MRQSKLRSYYNLCRGLEMTTTEVDKAIQWYAKRNNIPFQDAWDEMAYIADDLSYTLQFKSRLNKDKRKSL